MHAVQARDVERETARELSSGFRVLVVAHVFRPTHASCTETRIITINKEVTISSRLFVLIYLWSLNVWSFDHLLSTFSFY